MFLIQLFAILKCCEAQCLSGNCKDGEGKMDFGFAVYTGSFKNSHPNGTGTMDYGGGNKYAGSFVNGKEDGTGLLFTNGIAQPASYKNGVKQEMKNLIAIGGNNDWQKRIPGCISGDCANGTGTMKFPSGNTYQGSFKNYQFNGKGVMTFASGNVLQAEFIDHKPQSGSFLYRNEKVEFIGSFNEDGTPKSGRYSYPETGALVDISNGKIMLVRNPRQDSVLAANEKAKAKPVTCSHCGGAGGANVKTSSNSYIGGIGRVGSSGFVTWDYAPQTITHTSTSFKVCTFCGGSGREK